MPPSFLSSSPSGNDAKERPQRKGVPASRSPSEARNRVRTRAKPHPCAGAATKQSPRTRRRTQERRKPRQARTTHTEPAARRAPIGRRPLTKAKRPGRVCARRSQAARRPGRWPGWYRGLSPAAKGGREPTTLVERSPIPPVARTRNGRRCCHGYFLPWLNEAGWVSCSAEFLSPWTIRSLEAAHCKVFGTEAARGAQPQASTERASTPCGARL